MLIWVYSALCKNQDLPSRFLILVRWAQVTESRFGSELLQNSPQHLPLVPMSESEHSEHWQSIHLLLTKEIHSPCQVLLSAIFTLIPFHFKSTILEQSQKHQESITLVESKWNSGLLPVLSQPLPAKSESTSTIIHGMEENSPHQPALPIL